MNSKYDCEHDFKAFLICEKCKQTFEIAMVEIINQAKLDAANELLAGIKSKLESKGDINMAIDEASTEFERNLNQNATEIQFLGSNKSA